MLELWRSPNLRNSFMMRLFIAGSLLSLLLAASCDLATSNTLKDVIAVNREACEEECAGDTTSPGPVCDVNNAQYPNRCSAETCARVRLDEIEMRLLKSTP